MVYIDWHIGLTSMRDRREIGSICLDDETMEIGCGLEMKE
jgi:hypothetical protein